MRIELRETGPTVEVRLSTAQGLALRGSELVSAVPSTTPGWWLVGPASKVGVARVGDVEIWVKPKVSLRRLFFLIGYARDGRGWREEDLHLQEDADLLVAVATAFARQAERATQQGLIQGYRVEETASPVLRGRVRAAEQLKKRFGLAVPLEVRYDEYGVDIAENQLLRGAAEVLLRLRGVDAITRRSLLRLVRATADVTPLHRGSPLPSWQPSRLNSRYHLALQLAELVLRGASVEQAPGPYGVSGFMVDMAKLFEDFLTVALGEALVRRGGVCRAQEKWRFDEADAIEMKPDLIWYATDQRRPTAVIDAKYKAEKPSGFPNADLYQMLAYCSVMGLEHGHLVYAKGNEVARRHAVRRAGVYLMQHTLDLDQEPAALLDEVDRLAKRVAAPALGSLGAR